MESRGRNTLLGKLRLGPQSPFGKDFPSPSWLQTLTKGESDKLTLKNRYDAKTANYYWASELLETEASKYFRRQQEAEVIEYLSTLNNDPAAKGMFWEEHITYSWSSGFEGTLQSLETYEKQEFILRPRLTSFFDEFDNIHYPAPHRRPTSRKHLTCDGYILEQGIMLQIAVGEEHSINVDGLEKPMNSQIFGNGRMNIRGNN